MLQTPGTMKQQLLDLITQWRKESLAYTKLAGIKEDSKPSDSTPQQRGMAYSAATYRLCAKELNDLVKEL